MHESRSLIELIRSFVVVNQTGDFIMKLKLSALLEFGSSIVLFHLLTGLSHNDICVVSGARLLNMMNGRKLMMLLMYSKIHCLLVTK